MISAQRIVDVASRHGVHVTVERVVAAVHAGDLEPVSRRPLLFSEDAANAWLTALARRQGVLW